MSPLASPRKSRNDRWKLYGEDLISRRTKVLGRIVTEEEKLCGGVKHLTMLNSVETQQCSNELGIVLAIPSFLSRCIRVKSEKSEDLEYLAAINYEILEYVFWNKANCHINFLPNG